MNMSELKKKILVVQIREDKVTRDHELESIVRATDLGPDDLVLHDLTQGPIEDSALDGMTALIIGGSGEYSAHEDFPHRESLAELARTAVDSGMPVLGLCFGAQFLADELGGKCISDRENEEIGTYTLHKTAAAAEDLLLSDYPESFKAIEGHNCRVASLPEGSVVLVETERCPIQAYRFGCGNVYGFQFHPELDKDGLLWRLNYYAELYVDSKEQFDAIAAGAEDTPVSNRLLRDWLERIVKW